MAWIRAMGGNAISPNILTIFDSINGLTSGYEISGAINVGGTSPNLNLHVERGGTARIVPSIDCRNYNKLHMTVSGGYSSYYFIILNGNTVLYRETGENVKHTVDIDISNIDTLSINFTGSSATTNNYVHEMLLIK